MAAVKHSSKPGKKKRKFVAVVLTERELHDLTRAKRPTETVSQFVRAAIRQFASDRVEREG